MSGCDGGGGGVSGSGGGGGGDNGSMLSLNNGKCRTMSL